MSNKASRPIPPSNQEDPHLQDAPYVSVHFIHGFNDMFGRVDPKHEASNVDELHRTIRFGSKLLLSGPPGAGKTTFALATVRAMMARAESLNTGKRLIAYYISSEVDQKQLTTSFGGFGWFTEKTRATSPASFWFRPGSKQPDTTNFYAITPMPEVDRPVPSPEELVNGIFNRITQTLHPSESPEEHAIVYIIIDSISALLKGCKDAGEERRQTHEIMRRLQDRFSKENLAIIILLAEQDHRSQDAGTTSAPVAPTEPSVEDYLADVVFRLYVRNMPLGRRARILEVVKSQGVNMTLGEHTWQIVSDANCSEIIRHDEFRDDIRRRAMLLETKSKQSAASWGTIVIFPRQRLNAQLGAPSHDNRPIWSGTDALGYIYKGSITLIAGPMGSNKTRLCWDFLLADDKKAKESSGHNSRFLISFDTSEPPLEPALRRGTKVLRFTQTQFDLNVLVAHLNYLLDEAKENDAPRIAFDGLSEWITTYDKPEAARMLEALMISVQQGHGKRPEPTVFITYELPLGDDPLGPSALGTNADNILVIRPLAINDINRKIVYTLKRQRHPNQTDQWTSDQFELPPAELRWQDGRLLVDQRSLDAYTGLLSRDGVVKPAKVLVQLFAENHAENKFNSSLRKRLELLFRGRVDLTITSFDLSDVGSTLETALGPANPSESFNLSVHAVDEWWLGSAKIGKVLHDFQGNVEHKAIASPERDGHPSSHEFWWFELDKAGARSNKHPSMEGHLRSEVVANASDKGSQKVKKTNSAPHPIASACYALPGYMDFGMLCVDPMQLPAELTGEPSSTERDCWLKLVQTIPRTWAAIDPTTSEHGHIWFKLDPKKGEHLLDFGLKLLKAESTPISARVPVFAFDSSTRETCTCMFLELAWAFGAPEALLSKVAHPNAREGICAAFCFLQYMVMECVMSSGSIADRRSKPTLFSRQWYSTFSESQYAAKTRLRLRQDSDASFSSDGGSRVTALSRRGLVALPFMPIGGDSWRQHLLWLLDDLAVRQWHWWGRACNYSQKECLVELATRGEANSKLLLNKCLDLAQKGRIYTDSHDKQLLVMLNLALSCYATVRDWLLTAATVHVETKEWQPDLEDLLELAAWAAIRLQLILFGRSKDTFAKQARLHLPKLPEDVKELPRPLATGWVCSGSWMFGAGRKSRSAAIQSQLLRELTSLSTAELRAKAGAGLPARKDFFALRGDEPVKNIEYLNWRELLRFGGSRCRRRDRVLGTRPIGKSASEGTGSELALYTVIHQEMLACMRLAELLKSSYADGITRGEAIKRAQARAETAYGRIHTAAKHCHNDASQDCQ